MWYVHRVFFILSLSMAAVVEALSHRKPTYANNWNSFSPAVQLTLLHRTIFEYRPSLEPNLAQHLLKVFLNICGNYFLEGGTCRILQPHCHFAVGEGSVPGERGMRHWVRRTNLVDSRTSVTDVKFAPKSLGLLLATCSADGVVRIYEAPDVMNLSQWTLQHEVSCKLPCSCLSWNPSFNRLQ